MSEQEHMMERIAAYLDREMSAEERRAFEAEVESDMVLGAELETQRKLSAGLAAAPRIKAPPDFRARVLERVLAERGVRSQVSARVETVEPLGRRGVPSVSRIYRWGQWAAAACVLLIGVSIYTKVDWSSVRSDSVGAAPRTSASRMGATPGMVPGDASELTLRMEQLEVSDDEDAADMANRMSGDKPPASGYGGYGYGGYGYGAPRQSVVPPQETPIAVELAEDPARDEGGAGYQMEAATALPEKTLAPVAAAGDLSRSTDALPPAQREDRAVAEAPQNFPVAPAVLKDVTALRNETPPSIAPPPSMVNEFEIEFPAEKKEWPDSVRVASSAHSTAPKPGAISHEWQVAAAPASPAPTAPAAAMKSPAPQPLRRASEPSHSERQSVTPPPRYQDARSQTSVAQSLPPVAEMGIARGAIDGSGKGADSRIQSLFPPPERTEAKSFGAPTPKPATPLTHRSASEGMAGQDLSSGRDQDRWPALPKNSSQMLEMAPGAAAPPRPASQKRQFDPKVLDPAAPEGGAVVALVVYRNEGDSEPSALLRAQNDVEKALKKLNGDMKSSMLQTLADGHSVRETRIAIDPDKASQLIKELSNRGYKYNKSADGRPFSKVLDQTADALSKAQKAPKSGGALFIVHPLPKMASTQKKATAKSLAAPDLGSKGFAGPSTTPADMWIRIVCLP